MPNLGRDERFLAILTLIPAACQIKASDVKLISERECIDLAIKEN